MHDKRKMFLMGHLEKSLPFKPDIPFLIRELSRVNKGSSRNHGAFVKIEDFKMLKFRRIV